MTSKYLPFDSAGFVNSYTGFVKLVKNKNRGAQLVLPGSAMINGSDRLTVQNCLAAIRKRIDSLHTSGKKVALFFIQACNRIGVQRILMWKITPLWPNNLCLFSKHYKI